MSTTPAATTKTPSNSLPLALILHYISLHPSTLNTRASQDAFLTRLTKKHKFPYYSSTYGHTFHDPKSLRAVLVATVRNHAAIKTEEGKKVKEEPRGDGPEKEKEQEQEKENRKKEKSKGPVDALFRDGAKTLEPGYVVFIMRSLAEKPSTDIERMLQGPSSPPESEDPRRSNDSDADDDGLFDDMLGEDEMSSDSGDEDYKPEGTREGGRGRTKWARALGGKRKDDAIGSEGEGEDEEDNEGDSVEALSNAAAKHSEAPRRKKVKLGEKRSRERRPVSSGGDGHARPTGPAWKETHSSHGNNSMYANLTKSGLPPSALQRLAMDPPASRRWEGQGQGHVHVPEQQQPQQRKENLQQQSSRFAESPAVDTQRAYLNSKGNGVRSGPQPTGAGSLHSHSIHHHRPPQSDHRGGYGHSEVASSKHNSHRPPSGLVGISSMLFAEQDINASDIRINETELHLCIDTMAVKISRAVRGFVEDIQRVRRR